MPSDKSFSKKQITILIAFIAVLSVAGILYWKFKSKANSNYEEYSRYLESYTSGIISRESTIRIRLAEDVETTYAANKPLDEEIFEFSPGIKGKTYWVDSRTLEFRPDKNLKPDQLYNASFHLGKVMKVPYKADEFAFDFQTKKPGFEVEFQGLKAAGNTSLDKMKLSGILTMADAEESSRVEQLLKVAYPGKTRIVWQHNNETGTHQFTIEDITRGGGPQQINISWNGTPLDIKKDGSRSFQVPATGDFKVLDIKTVQDNEQYVLVQFSDPVRVGQELNGLLGISNSEMPAYTIQGSEVKLYPAERLEGNFAVFVNEGIENISGKKLPRSFNGNVFFENRLPSVTIPGKGVILPNSGKLMMPFEAVNLNAVDVTVIKIYGNNIPEYLQENSMDGEMSLRQVAKPVKQATIRLDDDKSVNLHKKTRFMLDIDKLMRTEPGAIYRITIGFRPGYSVYSCKNASGKLSDESNNENDNRYGNKIDEDDEFWNRYDNYYPYGFNWNERDDPCSNSYFNRERWASRNVLASNIGLIAKSGSNNSYTVAVTSILTAEPQSGVTLQFLDYQKQVIGETISGGEGIAAIALKRKPYLLIAKKGEERGYLKLDDGGSLPLSRFNTAGEQVQKGLKGFIYGERGVWRPGDSLFISFILDDKENKLPGGHPVTFDLYNPQGQLYKRITRSSALNGFYVFKTATEQSSPTGNWQAKIKAGGAVFEKRIRIETIMPNRLKINLSFGDKKILVKDEGLAGVLKSEWLFGGAARRLKARVDAYVSADKTSFPKFAQYTFDDPTRPFNSQLQNVYDGNLNENGVVTFKPQISTQQAAPGMLNASFMVKVFEPGGNFSIGQVSLPYSPYSGYVGIRTPAGDRLSGMLVTGQDHLVDIVSVDGQGNLLPGIRDVEVELYKIQWRWWWDEDENAVSNFTQDQYNKLVTTASVRLVNGKGKWNLHIDQPDWGRFLIRIRDPKTGHAAGKIVYADWPNWAERLQNGNPTEAAMLSFTSDKEKYGVGEEAVLTIPTANKGRALISIENGTKVIKTFWTDTRKGQTQYRFKIEKEMTPNIFVNVTLLQPHSQTINDLPIRMYGVIPLEVEDPSTELKPQISMAQNIRPETRSSLTVSEASGKAMTYTIALADEGLLDITGFKTPDPHSSFYAREGLGVKTWDLFDYVIGAYSGELQRILSIGGDRQSGKGGKNPMANRFKPVVKFMGPFKLKAGQKQTHPFTLPQYIGSVRAMVIAGADGAYGFAEKTVKVSKPLMVLATLPRVLAPGEQIRLPVTVFALDNNIKNVSIEVQSNTLISRAANQTTISFAKPGEQMVYFDLTSGNFQGIGKVRIIARSGREVSTDDVELQVRNPNPLITKVMEKTLEPGASWNLPFDAFGTAGTNTASLEVSSIPAIDLQKRLSYLIQYPHGCVEQITSSVFPQLYLSKLTDLTALRKAQTERNIRAGINKLNGFQLPDGGMSYWPGNATADEWSTNYAGHFMLEAEALGYTLPPAFLPQWKKYQRSKAISWMPSTENFYGGDLLQAYRLYLLALSRAPEAGAMNRLREFKYLSPAAKWRLAAAYRIAGRPEIAAALIKGLPLTVKPYNQSFGTFGSDLRDQAMILETLTLLGQKKQADLLVRSLAARLSRQNWYSTQSTAYALIAVAKYCGANAPGSRLQFSYRFNQQSGSVSSSAYLWQMPSSFSGKNSALVGNKSNKRLFVRLILQGKPDMGREALPVNNPDVLTMRVGYFSLNGQKIDPSKLVQGTDFIAQVNIQNSGKRGKYDNMALSQIFPSGWEIINTRLMNMEDAFRPSPADYRDIRDDRVNTYFSIDEGKELTYFVLLNASYPGKFYLPPVYCEAMYDSSMNASQNGQWVEVVMPPK